MAIKARMGVLNRVLKSLLEPYHAGPFTVSFQAPARVIPSPFALQLRTALSGAKGLRINSARNLALPGVNGNSVLKLRTVPDSSLPFRLLGMTGCARFFDNLPDSTVQRSAFGP